MLVQVSRDRDAAVPEPSRRRLERNARPQQERRVRVPKVMKAHVGQTGPPQRQLERTQHIPSPQWRSDLNCKRPDRRRPSRQPPACPQTDAPCEPGAYGPSRGRSIPSYGSSSTSARRTVAAAPWPSRVAGHTDQAVVHVNVSPLQSQQFALTWTRFDRQRPQDRPLVISASRTRGRSGHADLATGRSQRVAGEEVKSEHLLVIADKWLR